ncbi:hypothetical protein K458DRAFT_420492 [Lentithecium fluviatile CBS 122367]|uniref:Uncharacterized protein n=1 Tax=Lentithecium fluviatile CBS 122367 TaxID=1168545 RepID=A0A6G1IU18_9PLEO|nr:hypothetical protein K458DRAFT_420492 [Lentithecium fluviatile CBS 122367]
MSPTAPHTGDNNRKNRADYFARKKKAARERKAKVKIDSKSTKVRTLTYAARKKFRHERDLNNCICPWIRDEPTFRLQGRAYPPTHLLGLPREVRLQILELCLDDTDVTNHMMTYWHCSKQEQEKAIKWKIGHRYAKLSAICPDIRMEMRYIRRLWGKRYLNSPPAPSTANADPTANSKDPRYQTYLNGMRKKFKGKEVKMKLKQQPGKQTPWRPNKCWFCEERHPKYDRVCPLERRDTKRWWEVTKVVKKRKGAKRAAPAFVGEKVVFEG